LDTRRNYQHEEGGKLGDEELHILNSSFNVVGARKIRWARHAVRMGEWELHINVLL
jgi:hypothetical protein